MLPASIAARGIIGHAPAVHWASANSAGALRVRLAGPISSLLTALPAAPAHGARMRLFRRSADQLAAGATLPSGPNWCSIGLNIDRGATPLLCGVGPVMRCVQQGAAHSALQ